MNDFFITFTRRTVETFLFDLEAPSVSVLREVISGFVVKQAGVMLPPYRLGFYVLARVVDVSGILVFGRRFLQLPVERRLTLIHCWLKSSFGLLRQFMTWFLVMTLLAYEDQDETLHSIGVDPAIYRRMISLYHSEACYD